MSTFVSISDVGWLAVALVFASIIVLVITSAALQLGRSSKDSAAIPGVEPSDTENGNLLEVGQAGSLYEYILKLHQQYGPIVGFWWGKEHVVSLASPEYWKEIQHLYDKPYEQLKFFEPLLGSKNIAYYNGAEGRRRRQLMDRSFSHGAIKEYYGHFTKIAKQTADIFAKFPPQEHIPLGKHVVAFAIKAISVTGMGRFFMDDKEVDKLKTAYEDCWHEMEARLSGPMPAPDSEREKTFQNGRSYLKNTVRNLVNKRREQPDKDEKLFIDSILDCDFMDEEEICDNVITFLVGGFHTTGYMLTWCLYFLAKHLDIQEKVFQEIERLLGDEIIQPEVAAKLKYTRQVLDETMRVAVLAPWGARVCEHDLRVGNYIIPKETPVLLPFGVVLQDPKLWPEPERFDPDRFSPENIKERPSLAYQPFGFAGKRKCPGWRFSIFEGLVFLSILIKKIKFHLVEGQQVKPVHRLVTSPAEEVWVTVSKR